MRLPRFLASAVIGVACNRDMAPPWDFTITTSLDVLAEQLV
jgi:hypothetical protein